MKGNQHAFGKGKNVLSRAQIKNLTKIGKLYLIKIMCIKPTACNACPRTTALQTCTDTDAAAAILITEVHSVWCQFFWLGVFFNTKTYLNSNLRQV
jgi:hypothetical protein